MFSLINNKQSKNICVSISDHWLSAVNYYPRSNGVVSETTTTTAKSILSNLKLLVKKLKIGGKKCTITLLPEQYDVITLDKLAVRDDELEEAIKWNVHEKVNRVVDDILVEYVEVPKTLDNSKNSKLIAFVTSKKLVYELLGQCNNAGLMVTAVSITDISIANLLEIFCQKNNLNNDLIIFYYAHPTGGKIVIYYNGHILLIRNVVVSYTKDNINLLMDEFDRSTEFCRTTLKIDRNIVKLVAHNYLQSLKMAPEIISDLGLTTLNINDLAANNMVSNVQDENTLLLNFGIICQGMDKYVSV